MSTNVAVVGLGYWGPNLARNFNRLPGAELRWLCDLSEDLRRQYGELFPRATVTDDYDALLERDDLDAVVLATPVPTHHVLAAKALRAGKHVFVEKPLALTAADARELAELAEEHDRVLFVGHLLVYHPAVERMRAMIESGELGDVLYAYSHRLNLGQFRRDENALWSLGVHDVAMLMHLTGLEPVEVTASGESYLHDGVEDVVFGTIRFAGGTMAHIHLSWLDPHKVRRLTVVGSSKMVVFDDMQADRKLTVYDKGFTREQGGDATPGQAPARSYGEYITKREGDIWIPRVPNDEPLRLECQRFLDCISGEADPRSDGRDGLRVVSVLEGMQQSLEQGGGVVPLVPATASS